MAVKRVNHVGYVKCFSSYEIHDGSDLIELDVYHGRLAGLITAEVEFSSESQCEDFVPPPWFGKELTDDPRYKNKNLALHGLPKT